jgi:hypothetical protein
MFVVTSYLKYNAGLDSDIKFYDRRSRKILGGKMIFENQVVVLKKAYRKCEIEECNLEDITFNIYVGDENIRTRGK